MKNKKKGILFVIGSYYPEITGGAVQTRLLVNVLKKKYNCFILTTTHSNKYKSKSNIYRILYKNTFFFKILIFFKILLIFIKLNSKIDIVYLRGFTIKVLLIILLSKVLKKKIIYVPTRFREDDLKTLKLKLPILHKIFNYVDKIGFMSKSLDTTYDGNTPTQYLPNHVNKKIYLQKRKSSRPIILAVGFFSKIKNTKLTYIVWRDLFLKGYKSDLIFAGKYKSNYYFQDNRVYDFIMKDVKKYKLSNYIRIVGETKNIKKYYSFSNIFVLPSTTEGFSGSIIEAMINKNAVIISDLKKIHDIYKHNYNCLKIKVNSYKDYSNSLKILINDKKFRNKLGINGFNFVKNNFDINLKKNEKSILNFFKV